jgi:hypothetical protein
LRGAARDTDHADRDGEATTLLAESDDFLTDSDVFPTDSGDFHAGSDDFVTSFDISLTSFDLFLTSIDRFPTSFEIFPTSLDRTLTSFEIFLTYFDLFVTSFEIFPTYFDLFVTSFEIFPTYFDLFVTSFDLFPTRFDDFLEHSTDSDTFTTRVPQIPTQQPHPSNQLPLAPNHDTQIPKLGRHRQTPGRQTSTCERQSPQSATRPSKFHPHGPLLGPRIANLVTRGGEPSAIVRVTPVQIPLVQAAAALSRNVHEPIQKGMPSRGMQPLAHLDSRAPRGTHIVGRSRPCLPSSTIEVG